MAKFRPRIKGKGQRWRKGQSSSSNPSTSKYRDAAKSRFFRTDLGEPSLLTSEALQRHNAIIGSSNTENKPMEEDAEDDVASSVGASTFKSVDTFATDFSGCTNVSYSKMLTNFNPNSAIQKEKLAILAAVSEVIKSNGGTENNTEYFGALMTMLENGQLEEMSVSAVLSVLVLGIKGVPQAVLQLRFSQCTQVFLAVLAKYAESQNNIIFRGALTCLSVLLRSQDMNVWKDPSTNKVFDTILLFTVHSKPKVRRAAQHAVCSLLRASRKSLIDDSKYVQHPAAVVAANFCVQQIEKNGSLSSSATTTLHILGLMKDIMMTFPKKQLKIACETILKVMTLGNVMILNCGMQTLHGLFVSRPPPAVLSSELNAQLITALYDYQPQATDTQPTQAWLAVMQEATINLSRLNLSLCMTNLPRFLVAAEALWLTGKPEVMNAATLAIKACVEDCLTAASQPDVVHNYHNQISKVMELLKAGLSYQYHGVWSHVLHLIGVLFKAVGATCGSKLLPTLKTLAELRDSYQFTYMNELDYCVGNAVRSMGPELVLQAIPLQFADNDTNYDFKRSWIIPVLRENINSSTLKCFIDYFLPLAVKCKRKSEQLSVKNDKVGSVSYDLLQSQIWALLPSFCTKPTDIAQQFSVIAKSLGGVLGTNKDLRLSVMSALRKLIVWCKETGNLSDTKEMARYAKNYLPILFNIHTTPTKGTEENGIRLAALETISVYLGVADREICKELFGKAIVKLETVESKDFDKESVLDLLRVLVPHQPTESICQLYDCTVARLNDCKQHTQQKKYYRILEDICKCQNDGCREFFNTRFDDVQSLLLNSLSKSAPSSKGPRLRCIIHLLDSYPDINESLIVQTVPEAILSCRDINSQCRASAYELLLKMAEKMSEIGRFPNYVEYILAGLAGAPRLASATILALASVTYHYKAYITEEVMSILLDNMFVLMASSSREIVGSALSFIKLYITSFDQQTIGAQLKKMMNALSSMTEECKRHYRLKTRDILSRFVRWFGADNVTRMIPASETVMRVRVRNIRKIQDRKKKMRQEALEAKKNKSDDEFSVKKGPKSIDEILAESDSEIDMDEEQELMGNHLKKKKKPEAWIQEDDDDFMDFTVPTANRKITATKPQLKGNGAGNQVQMKQKQDKKDGGFKMAVDGRLIITDQNDSDDEPDKKKFTVPGLSDSDDYEDDDDDDEHMSVTDKKSRASASTKKSGFNRKRKLSVGSDGTGAPPMKYQAGGSGIHRPLNKGNSKQKKCVVSKKGLGTTGAEYRSKKARGDVKRKGLPDPYAYLPLQKNMLNRRKKMKAAGQFRNIVRHAKKGAKMGRINKAKIKK